VVASTHSAQNSVAPRCGWKRHRGDLAVFAFAAGRETLNELDVDVRGARNASGAIAVGVTGEGCDTAVGGLRRVSLRGRSKLLFPGVSVSIVSEPSSGAPQISHSTVSSG